MTPRFHDFTLIEARVIARRNDPGANVPSVSRTLLNALDASYAREQMLKNALILAHIRALRRQARDDVTKTSHTPRKKPRHYQLLFLRLMFVVTTLYFVIAAYGRYMKGAAS